MVDLPLTPQGALAAARAGVSMTTRAAHVQISISGLAREEYLNRTHSFAIRYSVSQYTTVRLLSAFRNDQPELETVSATGPDIMENGTVRLFSNLETSCFC